MLEQIEKQLIEACGLKKDNPLVLGVSGGPDSLFLLDVLWRLEWPILVAHLNHGLRPEADQEAIAVQKMADERGLPFALAKENVLEFANLNHLSIEEAARTLRYRFLFAQAQTHGAAAVAVAHTADDQVETVLMHLLRGAGLAGLAGMPFRQLPNPWSEQIPLVRPLLAIWRQQIETYLQSQGLTALYDLSNLDQRYYRNRIRNELIPFLAGYNPQVKTLLWRTATLARLDQEVLLQLEEQRWLHCLARSGEGFMALHADRLLGELPGMQLRLIRRAIACLSPGLRDIDYETSQRVLTFIRQPSRSGERDLAAGLRIYLEDDLLWLTRWGVQPVEDNWPQLTPGSEIPVIPPADLALPGGWRMQARLLSAEEDLLKQATQNPDPFQAWLDAATLSFPLHLRTSRPGERFQPLGMNGDTLKLSDFWINAKLARRLRPGWPLLVSGDQIAWLPGFRPAHFARLKPDSQQVLYLRFFREESSQKRIVSD